METIARWLGVPAAELAFGAETTGRPVDEEALERCIEAVIEAQKRTGKKLSAKGAAQMAAILYEEFRKGRQPETGSVDMLIRAIR